MTSLKNRTENTIAGNYCTHYVKTRLIFSQRTYQEQLIHKSASLPLKMLNVKGLRLERDIKKPVRSENPD